MCQTIGQRRDKKKRRGAKEIPFAPLLFVSSSLCFFVKPLCPFVLLRNFATDRSTKGHKGFTKGHKNKLIKKKQI